MADERKASTHEDWGMRPRLEVSRLHAPELNHEPSTETANVYCARNLHDHLKNPMTRHRIRTVAASLTRRVERSNVSRG